MHSMDARKSSDGSVKASEPRRNPTYGNWEQLGCLGSGTFGVVSMWKNKNTGEEIAIKVLRELKSEESTRSEARFVKEIEIMKRLNHENVVKVTQVPEEFSKLSRPLLCMEYCSEGNLREVLNKPDNCSGLTERCIRKCLKNVANGLEYLHSQHVIHRDLKPENIVLHKVDDEIVYKLIDLGVCKENEDSSLQTALVGTSQYVAPDVFESEDGYTASVDYWSLGVICHEMITGFRPFLPHKHILESIEKVRFKTDDVISVYEMPFDDTNNNLVFSEHLSDENRISKVLASHLERWLRLALKFDGKRRGRNKQNQLIIFSLLEEILDKKIITIFRWDDLKVISFEIDESTTETTLKALKQEVPFDPKVLLLRPCGEIVRKDDLLADFWDPNCKGPMLYLFASRGISHLPTPKIHSKMVTSMVERAKEPLPYYRRKKVFRCAVHYIQEHVTVWETSLKAMAVELLTETKSVKRLQPVLRLAEHNFKLCSSRFEVLEAKIKDSEFREESTQGHLGFPLKEKMSNSIKELIEWMKTEVNEIRLILFGVLRDVDDMKLPDGNIHEMKKCLEKAYVVIDRLRTMPEELRERKTNCTEMVDVMLQFLEVDQAVMTNQQLQTTISRSNSCKRRMTPLLSRLERIIRESQLVYADIQYVLKTLEEVWDSLPQFPPVELIHAGLVADRVYSPNHDPMSPESLQMSFENSLLLVADNQNLHQERV